MPPASCECKARASHSAASCPHCGAIAEDTRRSLPVVVSDLDMKFSTNFWFPIEAASAAVPAVVVLFMASTVIGGVLSPLLHLWQPVGAAAAKGLHCPSAQFVLAEQLVRIARLSGRHDAHAMAHYRRALNPLSACRVHPCSQHAGSIRVYPKVFSRRSTDCLPAALLFKQRLTAN